MGADLALENDILRLIAVTALPGQLTLGPGRPVRGGRMMMSPLNCRDAMGMRENRRTADNKPPGGPYVPPTTNSR